MDYHIRAMYSPDGRYVVAGSDDGSLFAWVEESGDRIFDGFMVGFHGPLLQLAWSATDHVLAMCSYGAANPVLVYFHDPNQVSQQFALASAMPSQSHPRIQSQAQPRHLRETENTISEGGGTVAERTAALLLGSTGAAAGGVGPLGSSAASGRGNSAVRRARRNGNLSEDASLQGSSLTKKIQRPADAALVADADVLSARRKAAAAARRALASTTAPGIT